MDSGICIVQSTLNLVVYVVGQSVFVLVNSEPFYVYTHQQTP